MIYLKTEEEINLIKVSAQILGKAHAEVATWVKPGVTTGKLDAVAEEYIRDNGGIPSFKGFNKFPASLCISVKLNGYHSDSAYTYPVGEVSKEVMNLLTATKKSLYKGIEQAVDGLRIGDIGHAVQSYVEDRGYTVVRELVGHGVGRDLHEAPEVPNYGKRGKGIRLREGMVLAIEPMINLGTKGVVQERDGWTIRTNDRKYSAHFEHTVVVRKGKAEILTTFDYIEKVTANTSLMVEVQ